MYIRRLKVMLGWRFIILIGITFTPLVNSNLDLDSSIAVARYRAFCLYKCSRACGAVTGGGSALCASNGCDCGVTHESYTPTPPRQVSLEEALVVTGSRISWPTVSDPVVYVVIANGSQLLQTLESSVILPPTVDSGSVRVLVVDLHGLAKVLVPVVESPVDQALHILRSVGMEDRLGLEFGSSFSNTHISKAILHRIWRLKVDSIHNQPPLVLGRISWRNRPNQLFKDKYLTSYLVTWVVEDGILRGNLLTNTSAITLSLLPDTQYRIQVTVLNPRSANIHSEVLVLDTHHYSKNTSSSTSLRKYTGLPKICLVPTQRYGQFEEAVAIGFILFVTIASAAWMWRYRDFPPKRKLLFAGIDCPSVCKGGNL